MSMTYYTEYSSICKKKKKLKRLMIWHILGSSLVEIHSTLLSAFLHLAQSHVNVSGWWKRPKPHIPRSYSASDRNSGNDRTGISWLQDNHSLQNLSLISQRHTEFHLSLIWHSFFFFLYPSSLVFSHHKGLTCCQNNRTAPPHSMYIWLHCI